MILYTKTQTIYFNSQGELDGYLDAQASADNIPRDIATSVKLTGMAIERPMTQRSPTVVVHVVSDVPQVHIGPLKE